VRLLDQQIHVLHDRRLTGEVARIGELAIVGVRKAFSPS
jgi:hypothetical protein